MKRRNKNLTPWFILSLSGIFLAAPNATIIRLGLNHTTFPVFNLLRFIVITLVTLPSFLRDIRKLTRKNASAALQGGIYMSIAVLSYTWAIAESQASYVAIITLLTPLVFIVYSARLTGEKISMRGVAGITLAAVGALVIVALPVALNQSGTFIFYPFATVLALVNCLAFPMAIIKFKQANEAGLPYGSLMMISSAVIVLFHAVVLALFYADASFTLDYTALFTILYSALAVSLLSRVISIVAYEKLGSVVSSALAYLETLLAILLPIFILGEKLSVEMVVGGILILLGLYVVEHHKSLGHKHFYSLRHH
jgi:drug/metabolite transporter (DMT)-like permease